MRYTVLNSTFLENKNRSSSKWSTGEIKCYYGRSRTQNECRMSTRKLPDSTTKYYTTYDDHYHAGLLIASFPYVAGYLPESPAAVLF